MGSAAGSLIGAGGSLLGGLFGSSAAEKAGKQQADAARYAAELQLEGQKMGLEALAPQRNANTNFLMNIARVMGVPWAGSKDVSTGYTTEPFGAGQSQDPFTYHDPDEFLKATQPYIEALQPITNKSLGVFDQIKPLMDQFLQPAGEGGIPPWAKAIQDAFIPSRGYQFQKQEAINAGLQGAPGMGSGGRVAEITRRATGGAQGDYYNYLNNALKETELGVTSGLSAAQTGLTANQQGANLLGTGLNWLTAAMQKPYDLFAQYFRNLTQAAGLGSTAPGASANLIGQTMGQAGQYEALAGRAEAGGTVGASNAMWGPQGGFTGAVSQLTTGTNAPFSSTNPNNWLSSFGGSSSQTASNTPIWNSTGTDTYGFS